MKADHRISLEDALAVIHAEAVSTMTARASTKAFGCVMPRATMAILERLPTIRATYGYVPTEKLVELVAEDLGVGERQAYRLLQDTCDDNWVLQVPHPTRGNSTDNKAHYERNVPQRMAEFTAYCVQIGKVVECQIADPLNHDAGRDLIDPDVYANVVQRVEARRAELAKEAAARAASNRRASGTRIQVGGKSLFAMLCFAGSLAGMATILSASPAPIKIEAGVSAPAQAGDPARRILLADKESGWVKL